MGDLTAPLATLDIDGVPVRFFCSPESGPHLPWHALDDLYRAMRFDRALRKRMLRHAQAFPGADFKTVATKEGPVVIGSHPMAQGLIGAAAEAKGTMHGVPANFEAKYVEAAAAAMNAFTGNLPPMEALRLTITAARNTLGVGQ